MRGRVEFPPKKPESEMSDDEKKQKDILDRMEAFYKARSRKKEVQMRRNPDKFSKQRRAQRILKKDKLKTV